MVIVDLCLPALGSGTVSLWSETSRLQSLRMRCCAVASLSAIALRPISRHGRQMLTLSSLSLPPSFPSGLVLPLCSEFIDILLSLCVDRLGT